MTGCLSTEGIGDRRPAAMAQGSSDEVRTCYILKREIVESLPGNQMRSLRPDAAGQ